jgi:hypothetical protein
MPIEILTSILLMVMDHSIAMLHHIFMTPVLMGAKATTPAQVNSES